MPTFSVTKILAVPDTSSKYSDSLCIKALYQQFIDYKSIDVVPVGSIEMVEILSWRTNDTHPTEYLWIYLKNPLKSGRYYSLRTQYIGYLKNDNFGFYIR